MTRSTRYSPQGDTDELLRHAAAGDAAATRRLFDRHRLRLRKMLEVRLDAKLSVRVDPSDIIQEALIDAARTLSQYVAKPDVPFYVWLREIAIDRLLDQYRRHSVARRRATSREVMSLPMSDQSASQLAAWFTSDASGPGERLQRGEVRAMVRAALDRLEPTDREILILRHLEQMPVAEIAAVLDISEGAVKMRRLRAVARLRELLDEYGG